MSQLRLIFDLDDTLYPERSYAIGGFRAAGTYAEQQFGVTGLATRLTELLDAGHLGKSFAMALAELRPDHTPDDLAALVKAYGAHTPDLTLFDDAAAALDAFAGTPMGLITDGHDKTQMAKVRALGIAPRFREIIYTGALGPNRAFHKPHPMAFERMEAALNRQPGEHFVYVGDNPAKDFLAPNARGWTTVLIDRPSHRPHRIHPLTTPVEGGAAQHRIDTLGDLKRVLT